MSMFGHTDAEAYHRVVRTCPRVREADQGTGLKRNGVLFKGSDPE